MISWDMPEAISIACEGILDRTALSRLLTEHELPLGPVYELGGKTKVDRRIQGYVNAGRFSPWLVQRDLDDDAECAPELLQKLAPDRSRGFCMIIPVRQTESWLIADQAGLADYLKVPASRIPGEPETLPDAKVALVDLARRSRSREIREGMVPGPNSGRKVGAAYTALMQQFIVESWNPRGDAKHRAPSLAKLMFRLSAFRRTGNWGRRGVLGKD
ncbi:MAG: hypothetical protein JO323_17775 [Acidobacteriia bacterium]|nr:hypothetical protein [Terriglobia bacterium]